MPRTSHVIQPVSRKGRSTYFQASINGEKVYLGTSRPDAKRRLAAILDEQARPAPLGEMETIGALARSYLKANPRLPERYILQWIKFAGEMDLEDVRPDHLTAYHEYLKTARYRRPGKGGKPGPWKRYSAKTIRHYLTAAATILKWAHQSDRIRSQPVKPKTARPANTPRDMPLQTVAELLAALRPKARAIVGFIFHTGCRPSEACRLRWEWFRPTDGTCGSFVLPLESHKTGKATGEDKTIYLTPDARAIVDGLLRLRPHVFVNSRGEQWTSDAIQSATVRRGVSNPYRLRHTFATNALASGVQLHVVRDLLGHKSIVTTEKYTRRMSKQASDAASSLSLLSHVPAASAEQQTSSASKPRRSKRA